MSMCRRFHGEPVTRLIVSVPVDVVAEVDSLIAGRWYSKHPAKGCRAEFIRIAIAEKLERDRQALRKWT
jgi:metal-responsive CopG/Arc/MetJ family transcriptional regulator